MAPHPTTAAPASRGPRTGRASAAAHATPARAAASVHAGTARHRQTAAAPRHTTEEAA